MYNERQTLLREGKGKGFWIWKGGRNFRLGWAVQKVESGNFLPSKKRSISELNSQSSTNSQHTLSTSHQSVVTDTNLNTVNARQVSVTAYQDRSIRCSVSAALS